MTVPESREDRTWRLWTSTTFVRSREPCSSGMELMSLAPNESGYMLTMFRCGYAYTSWVAAERLVDRSRHTASRLISRQTR